MSYQQEELNGIISARQSDVTANPEEGSQTTAPETVEAIEAIAEAVERVLKQIRKHKYVPR